MVEIARNTPLGVFETVRCLDCGSVYSKPAGGGTVRENPGCPDCAYVGWIPVSLPPVRREQHRHVAGQRRLLFAR
jgi:hypothetical protein